MKIVHLSSEMPLGGLTNYVLQLVKSFKGSYPDMQIACLNPSIPASIGETGIEITHVKSIYDLAALKPDLVHVHLLNDVDFIKSLFTLDVPLLRMFHDYTSTCLRRGKRRWPGDRCHRPLNMGCAAYGCIVGPPLPGNRLPRLMNLFEKIHERNLYRKFDSVVVGSRHMAGMLLKNGFSADKIAHIPYFSAFAREAETIVPKMHGAARGRPLEFLFSGQAVTGKGLEILIEALAGLEKHWRLTVFSEGPRLAPAKELAKKYGIDDLISFRGWVPHAQLAESYRAADVFILPSIWDDPGPLVGIEALSFGTPVVAFAVGGISDYVYDERTGYLVNDTTPAGLNRALAQCIENPEKLAPMGSAGQALVRENHTLAVHLKRLEDLYKSLI